jgi:hypothetical protein
LASRPSTGHINAGTWVHTTRCSTPFIGKFPGFAFFNVEVNLSVDYRWLRLVSGSSGTISIPLVIGQDGEATSE